MFARTERLLLRPGWQEDAQALYEAISDERVVRNLAQAPWPYRPADAEAFLDRERSPHEPACLIFLRTKAAPRLIGGIGLGRMPTGETELGITGGQGQVLRAFRVATEVPVVPETRLQLSYSYRATAQSTLGQVFEARNLRRLNLGW